MTAIQRGRESCQQWSESYQTQLSAIDASRRSSASMRYLDFMRTLWVLTEKFNEGNWKEFLSSKNFFLRKVKHRDRYGLTRALVDPPLKTRIQPTVEQISDSHKKLQTWRRAVLQKQPVKRDRFFWDNIGNFAECRTVKALVDSPLKKGAQFTEAQIFERYVKLNQSFPLSCEEVMKKLTSMLKEGDKPKLPRLTYQVTRCIFLGMEVKQKKCKFKGQETVFYKRQLGKVKFVSKFVSSDLSLIKFQKVAKQLEKEGLDGFICSLLGAPHIIETLGFCCNQIHLELADLDLYQYFNGGFLRNNRQKIVQILLGIAKGLRFFKERGIIYTDLKPENVFLFIHPNGQITAKLGDLEALYERIPGQRIVSSPDYHSPELFKYLRNGEKKEYPIGHEHPIWIYGIIAFVLLVECLPFKNRPYEPSKLGYDKDYLEKLIREATYSEDKEENNKMIAEKLDLVNSADPQGDVRKIIVECLKTDPKERISIEEIITRLEGQPKNLEIAMKNLQVENSSAGQIT